METTLVSINYTAGDPTVLGRDLHKALEVGSRYNDWFKRMCEYGFERGVDYTEFYSDLSKTHDDNNLGGRPAINHQLTIDMAKEVAMIQRTPKGKEIRLYFIETEKKWRTSQVVPMTQLEIAKMSLDMLIEQEHRLAEQEQKTQLLEENLTRLQEDHDDLKNEIHHPNDYFSVAGYANKVGLRVDVQTAAKLGKKATKESTARGYQIYKINDPRFGTVNTYHSDILKDILNHA